MGEPKQLIEFRGKPLVRHVADTACRAGYDAAFIVVGAYESHVRRVLRGCAGTVVVNSDWEKGIGTSIRCAVEAVGAVADSFTLVLADQPYVTQRAMGTLLTTHLVTTAPVVASRYEGTVGVPALFHKSVFAELLALADDEGCKRVIRAHSAEAAFLDMPDAAFDVDTPADVRRLHQVG